MLWMLHWYQILSLSTPSVLHFLLKLYQYSILCKFFMYQTRSRLWFLYQWRVISEPNLQSTDSSEHCRYWKLSEFFMYQTLSGCFAGTSTRVSSATRPSPTVWTNVPKVFWCSFSSRRFPLTVPGTTSLWILYAAQVFGTLYQHQTSGLCTVSTNCTSSAWDSKTLPNYHLVPTFFLAQPTGKCFWQCWKVQTLSRALGWAEQHGGRAEPPLLGHVWMLCGARRREEHHGETGGGKTKDKDPN